MKPTPIIAALTLVFAFAAAPALAASDSIKFDGAIGSQPLRSGPAANLVFNVSPGGIPWVIESFKAEIKPDGRISARGEGLLLAGGNAVGARGGVRFVAASLFCPGVAEPFNSEAAELDQNGDFNIRSPLTDANGVSPPVPCGDDMDNRPVLLIRNATAAGGVAGAPSAWFAAGILKD